MKKITMNTFSKGMNMDLNPLTTPKDVLTDCLNGTIITYNGDEFNLQTELGNVKVQVTSADDSDIDAIPPGFIPLGIKEFGGIMYMVVHNPVTKETRVGSLPSPQRYITISDGDNLTKKTIAEIESESLTLKNTVSVNHGMNLLTGFITDGDKFIIALTLNGVTEWTDANNILRLFINNYDPTHSDPSSVGYFDFNYYIMDIDGTLTPIDITLIPNLTTEISDIRYTPVPTFAENPNGVTKVYTESSKAIIVLIMTPSTIQTFDFTLTGNSDNDILKGKIVIDKDLIVENNSAIKINSIKIQTTSSDGSTIGDRYFDYVDFRGSMDTTRDILVEKEDPSAESFAVDTVLTVTCTPIDQFGRELTSKAITKTHTISTLPFGVDAHNLFTYSISGDILTLNYNFLYKGPSQTITETNIEFYDFWSNVSLLKLAIPIDPDTGLASTTIGLYTAEKTTTFDGSQTGGLLNTDITSYAGSDHPLSVNRKMVPDTLRKNHCYIVRIFGKEDGKDYNIFQLLYTLPLPILTNSNQSNFGTIDIVRGLESGDNYALNYDGTIIISSTTTPLVLTPIPIDDGLVPNYKPTTGHSSFTYLEAYRLYGGPVFNETYLPTGASALKTAEWPIKHYYRNVYNGEFYDNADSNVTGIGYHNFADISSKLGLTEDGAILTSYFGINTPYLISGVKVDALSSADFRFSLATKYIATPGDQSGTIKIVPYNLDSTRKPLLFGEIDHSLFAKSLKLKNTTYANAVSTFDIGISYVAADIDSVYVWHTPATALSYASLPKSASLGAKLESTDILDTFTLYNITLNGQRTTSAPSLFWLYNRFYNRNKNFKYFSWLHNQTIESKRLITDDADNLALYTTYELSGGTDRSSRSFDLIMDLSNPASPALGQFKILSQLGADISLSVEPNDISSPEIIKDTIANIGYIIEDIPENFRGSWEATDIPLEADSKIIGCFTSNPSNTTLQTIYQQFKTSTPVYVKLLTGGSNTLLDTYNNLWRSNSSGSYIYVGMKNLQNTDYLNDLLVYQRYRETILAQYPDPDNINYIVSGTDTLNLTTNTITYTLNSSETDTTLKYLTKICFGSSTLVAFTVKKIYDFLQSWITTNIATSKVLYDFTDPDKSIGSAKNIPWNFSNIQTSVVPIEPIHVVLDQASPSIGTAFTDAKTNLEASSYMTSDSAATPAVKAIIGQAISSTTSSYFTLTSSLAANNINNYDLQIPLLNVDALSGRIVQRLPQAYGVDKICLDQPTIAQVVLSSAHTIGERFGGGIIYYIYQFGDPGYDALVQHGLIAALEDQSTGIWWEDATATGGGICSCVDNYTTGADGIGIGDGVANTIFIAGNCCASHWGVSTVVSYVVGGYDDWSWPSQGEMQKMYDNNLQGMGVGISLTQDYWTSSEATGSTSDHKAIMFNLSTGNVGSVEKKGVRRIRAIRYF